MNELAKRKEIDFTQYTDEQLIGMVEEAKQIPEQKSGEKGTNAFAEYFGVGFTYSQATYELAERGYELGWVKKSEVPCRTNAQKIEASVKKAKELFFEDDTLDRISVYVTKDDHQIWAYLMNQFRIKKHGEAALMHTLLESFSVLFGDDERKEGEHIVKKNRLASKKRFKKK